MEWYGMSWNVLVNLMTICVLTSDVLMNLAASREELGGSQDKGSGRQVSFIGARSFLRPWLFIDGQMTHRYRTMVGHLQDCFLSDGLLTY